MIADIISNKRLTSVVTEVFIRVSKLNILLAFITQSYMKVLKDVRLKCIHYFITKIPNKRKFQQLSIDHSSDIELEEVEKIHITCIAKTFCSLGNDTILPSDNLLRKNIKSSHNNRKKKD